MYNQASSKSVAGLAHVFLICNTRWRDNRGDIYSSPSSASSTSLTWSTQGRCQWRWHSSEAFCLSCSWPCFVVWTTASEEKKWANRTSILDASTEKATNLDELHELAHWSGGPSHMDTHDGEPMMNRGLPVWRVLVRKPRPHFFGTWRYELRPLSYHRQWQGVLQRRVRVVGNAWLRLFLCFWMLFVWSLWREHVSRAGDINRRVTRKSEPIRSNGGICRRIVSSAWRFHSYLQLS